MKKIEADDTDKLMRAIEEYRRWVDKGRKGKIILHIDGKKVARITVEVDLR